MQRITTILLIAFTTALIGCQEDSSTAGVADRETEYFSPYVDDKGNISRPDNFREDWTHLGTWFVKADEMASGPGVHDVYATPESVKAFRENGQWPDGTVLVKTVSDFESKRLTTGNARWTGETGVWFVMIRDRKNRFPDNKAWGEGWGWALFTAEDPDRNVTTNWRGTGFNNCFGCHAPAKDTDWVYIDGYPTVRDQARFPKLADDRNLLKK